MGKVSSPQLPLHSPEMNKPVKKKGRPPLKQQKPINPSSSSSPNRNRKSSRRHNSPELPSDDDDEREKKKVKLVVRLPQSSQQQHSDNSSDDDEEEENSVDNPETKSIINFDRSGDKDAQENDIKPADILHGSSLGTGPTTPLPDKKLLVFILGRLQKKDTYGVFSEPVDPNELPDYHETIKHPMDFGTVRRKLDSGSYLNLEQLESNLQRPGNQKASNFDERPLWNHVTVLQKAAAGGGNRTWTCNYCQRKVVGSYSKVKAHLLKISNCGIKACPNITQEILATLKREDDAAEIRRQQEVLQMKQKAAYLTLPQGSDLSQQKKRKGNTIEEAFNVVERDAIDKAFARAFYASAVSFNLSRCPYFRKALLMLSYSNVPGYVLPRYDRFRTTLLAQEKGHIAQKLQPIKDTWRRKGVSICSDGWTDIQKKPLINIMAASSGAAMFLKSVNTNGIRKDAEYVASVFLDAMEEVGAQYVVQIVTDNAANYKAAGEIIESKHPHIFWTPCVVHSINLALKSICEPAERSGHYQNCKWILQILNDVQDIRNFIVNHNLALSIFTSHSDLTLLRVAETRFASHLIMARRFRKVYTALQKMVMDVKWQAYREEKNNVIANKAREVKRCILDDFWWDQLDYILAITEPIVGMLREGDKDAAVLHLIYDMWDSMIEDVKKVIFTHEGEDLITGKSEFFEAIHHILVSRWNKSNTALHCLAHSLVPKYYCESWLRGGNNGIMRISPHEDEEVSVNRNKCFKRLFPNPTDLQKVFTEFGAFSTGSGYFNQAHVIDGRITESAVSWWANHGTSTPMLQALAFKLLEQPASSSCTERNWSTYSLIQTVKRNRLETSRTEDLVFVHNNLRVLSRKDDEYVKGPSKFWDVCGDNFDPDGNIGEFAQLSLDEPEFEAMIQEGEEEDI